MKQIMKKVIAVICAITMIVSSITIYNNTAGAAEGSVPVMTGNPLVQLNNFGAGEVIYVAGLDVIKDAASYNLYVDGTLWGSVANGANLEISNFASGSHLFQVTGVNAAGESDKSAGYTIVIPEQETTAAPEITDGEELLKGTLFTDADTTTDESSTESLWMELSQDNTAVYTNNGDSTVSVSVVAYESGDNWATQLKQNNVQLVKDKWYVAKFAVTSDVDKKIQLLIQHNVNWSIFAEKVTTVSAGTTEEVELVFQATQTTNSVLFGIMMGYVDNTASEAANVTISNVSLKGYNSNPNGEAEVTTADKETSEITTADDETSEVTTTETATPQITTAEDETQEITTVQTAQNENTEAAGYSGLAYEAFLQGETGQNQYKAVCAKGTIDKIVNIQQYGAATEPGIYVAFKDADIGEITVNGMPLDAFVDGAGIIMYLSNFEYMYSDVVVKSTSGAQKAVIYVYNSKGIDNSDKAIIQPGEEGETSSDFALQIISPFGKYLTYGSYKIFISSDKEAYAGLDPINGDHLRVQNTSGPGGTQSKLTLARTFTGLTAGTKYVLSVDITPSVAQGTYTTMTDSTPRALQEGTTTVSIVTKAYGAGQADFSMELNGIGADVILDVYNPQCREYVEGEEDDMTTQAPVTGDVETSTTGDKETPTGDVIEPITTEPTTGNEETTTGKNKPVETTVAPTAVTSVKVTAPAKAKIKKITAKKKSAKKVKMTLKKVNGANGYQIAVYKTKKNAKNNKKAVIKKYVKTIKVSVKSKKLKNKKKLFVKARAYVLDANGKKVYGKWSKVKKVKIKK